MFFSVINKNLNREISTKNLVTFKRWEGGGVVFGVFRGGVDTPMMQTMM